MAAAQVEKDEDPLAVEASVLLQHEVFGALHDMGSAKVWVSEIPRKDRIYQFTKESQSCMILVWRVNHSLVWCSDSRPQLFDSKLNPNKFFD